MSRPCWHCGTPFRAEDFDPRQSCTLQEACRTTGLRGVRFLCYNCLRCGRSSVLLEVRRLPGEESAGLQARRQSLQQVAREVSDDDTGVIVTW
jgi:hypothetical protein